MMIVALAGVVLALAAGEGRPPQQSSSLEIRYLGNMGVALAAEGRLLVIDGFHHGQLRDYAAVPPELLAPLEGATEPFRSLVAGLATHRHLDHFAAASVVARLRSDPEFRFVAPADALDSVRSRSDLPSGASDRLLLAFPPAGGRKDVSVAGVRIEALDLPHNPVRHLPPSNVGYLIRLGGFTVLHVGDAEPEPKRYAPHRLPAEQIDVAILPYWYATSAADLIRTAIAPRTLVLSHVEPSESARLAAEIGKAFPGSIVLTKPGDRHTIAAKASGDGR